MPNASGSPRRAYPAEKARQGAIVLRTRPERIIFIVGLVAALVIALVLILGLR